MSFNRDQFKATSTKKLKTLKDQEDKVLGSNGSDQLESLEIKDGMNKVRIAPKFPNEDEFYHMVKRVWLPFEKEDGEVTNIPVLDSKLHGGTERDIVQEYLAFVKTRLDPKQDTAILTKLSHWKDGLVPQIFWESYGWKLVKGEEPTFGIFEFKKTVRDELCSLSIIEDEDEAIEMDPFTDVEDGRPILLTYDSKSKKASDYYKVKLSKSAYPITDEMFDELTSQKPLSESLKGVYTLETFEKALSGLTIYDVDNEIDLLGTDEFQDIVDLVREQYTGKVEPKAKVEEDEEDEEETPKPRKKVAKKTCS